MFWVIFKHVWPELVLVLGKWPKIEPKTETRMLCACSKAERILTLVCVYGKRQSFHLDDAASIALRTRPPQQRSRFQSSRLVSARLWTSRKQTQELRAEHRANKSNCVSESFNCLHFSKQLGSCGHFHQYLNTCIPKELVYF